MKPGRSELALRTLLALVGGVIVFTGVNVAFGGIATLGLQGATAFFQVTDQAAFREHDSHVRFLGGVWLAVGLLFVASAWRLGALAPALVAALAMIFVGGLARLSAGDLEAVLSPGVLGSWLAELLLMPLLLAWVVRVRRDAGRQVTATTAPPPSAGSRAADA